VAAKDPKDIQNKTFKKVSKTSGMVSGRVEGIQNITRILRKIHFVDKDLAAETR
jgi:hypothetical protein